MTLFIVELLVGGKSAPEPIPWPFHPVSHMSQRQFRFWLKDLMRQPLDFKIGLTHWSPPYIFQLPVFPGWESDSQPVIRQWSVLGGGVDVSTTLNLS